jgi:hypothetical protein
VLATRQRKSSYQEPKLLVNTVLEEDAWGLTKRISDKMLPSMTDWANFVSPWTTARIPTYINYDQPQENSGEGEV